MTTDKDTILLPTYVFKALGKRSALMTKKKYGDKYSQEMSKRGKLGGRPKKQLKQAKENKLISIDKPSR